jgi:hypothetical protein
MKRIIFKSITICTVIFYSNLTYSQAWSQPKGMGFYKLDYTVILSDQVFNNMGEVKPMTGLDNHTFSFYGEHGITNKFTVQAYVPILVRNVLSETKDPQTGIEISPKKEINSFGDVDIAFRYQLFKGTIPVSASLLLGIPTGNSREALGLLSGDGEFNQLLKINAGYGTKKWWTQIGLGYNNRSNNFSDELRYDAEIGYKILKEKLQAIIRISAIKSTNNGDKPVNSFGLFSNNVEYISPGLELLYFIKPKIGVSFRAAGAYSGKNVLASPSYSIGVFSKF